MRRLLSILLQAVFVTSTSAVVSWEQPIDAPDLTITCLVRIHAGGKAGICWNDLAEGTQRVPLPGALTHPDYRPAYGDRIELHVNGDVVGSTTLGESAIYRVYLPGIRKDAPRLERVLLPWVGR